MITFLRGRLAGKIQHSPRGPQLILDVNGVGYEVLTSARTLANNSMAIDTEVLVHTALVIREDAHTLVGFLNRDERDLFNILQSASGVGVKVALALISDLSVLEIVQAVIAQEYRPLTTAKGVGPKLAQKMILELKEKMTAWQEISGIMSLEASGSATSKAVPDTEAFAEAQMVLLSLGYLPDEVHSALGAVAQQQSEESQNSEILLRESLRWLASV